MIRILQQIYHLQEFLRNFIFFSKNLSIFLKNPNFERFGKSCFFSGILRQICYHLMEEIDFQTREQAMLARLARAHLAKIG